MYKFPAELKAVESLGKAWAEGYVLQLTEE